MTPFRKLLRKHPEIFGEVHKLFLDFCGYLPYTRIHNRNSGLASNPSIEVVGAAFGRPPNYLLANNLISEGNNRIIAYGNPDLLHKSGGRPKAAPTASQGHFREQQLDKPEFGDQ